MEPVLIGFFPKEVQKKPEWLKAQNVEEICSASECFSECPGDWINYWVHNELWVFSSEDIAWSVVPEESREKCQMFAYRMFPVQFENREQQAFEIPVMNVQPLPNEFVSLGYDAVSREFGNSFEHSPLSCNNASEEFPVNQFCLVEKADQAFTLARLFSEAERYEPGPYFVVEVLRRKPGMS